MKNHMLLLLGFVCVNMHAMEDNAPVTVRIRYFNRHGNNIAGYIYVVITPSTNIYDVQDEIRRHVGSGDLKAGSMKVGERDVIFRAPVFNAYGSPLDAKKRLEQFYTFRRD